MALSYLTSYRRVAKAAAARRAARCEAANEPQMARTDDAPDTLSAGIMPIYDAPIQVLAADRFAPSRLPEAEPATAGASSFKRRAERIEPGSLQDAMIAAARKLTAGESAAHGGALRDAVSIELADNDEDGPRLHDRKRMAR